MVKNDVSNGNDGEITLRMVMNDMHAGFGQLHKDIRTEFREEINTMEKRMLKEMREGFAEIRYFMRWTDEHDLPTRVSRLEDKVFAGIDYRNDPQYDL